MRVVCISDTHAFGAKIEVPDGDCLIHAGDLTFRGTDGEITAAFRWLASLPHPHKVVIAGNHDWLLDPDAPSSFRDWRLERKRSIPQMLAEFPSLTYLKDSAATIAGLKFYGSPWTPRFCDWAFNFPAGADGDEAAKRTWAAIPDDTQVLVTHGPPAGILDSVYSHTGDTRAGDPWLRARVEQLEALRLHCFGHLHESYGRLDYATADDETRTVARCTFVNAAINTREYVPLNKPIVVDL